MTLDNLLKIGQLKPHETSKEEVNGDTIVDQKHSNIGKKC